MATGLFHEFYSARRYGISAAPLREEIIASVTLLSYSQIYWALWSGNRADIFLQIVYLCLVSGLNVASEAIFPLKTGRVYSEC